MSDKNQKLELTWIGKDEQPGVEPLLELEGRDVKGYDGSSVWYHFFQ
ncbi:MAG: hypothetical protein M1510_13025 [Nitrospirae bacterium]|nr:hypothetical protein [Nitrospirota bacterium]